MLKFTFISFIFDSALLKIEYGIQILQVKISHMIFCMFFIVSCIVSPFLWKAVCNILPSELDQTI